MKNVFFFTILSQLENGKERIKIVQMVNYTVKPIPEKTHILCYSNITGTRSYAGCQKGIGQVRNTSTSSAGTSRGRNLRATCQHAINPCIPI